MAHSDCNKGRKSNAGSDLAVKKILQECFETAILPIVCLYEGAILYQNPAAQKDEALAKAIQSLIEEKRTDDQSAETDVSCWKAHKLANIGSTEVFIFTKHTNQGCRDDVYEEIIRQLAHEFRTPLNSIMGFTEIMLEETDDEATRDYLMAILRASESLVTMLAQVLDFGRIAAGKFSVEPSPVDMESFAELLRLFFLPQARRSNLEFTVTLPKNLPPILVFDAGRVRQILFNLISNALKYTFKGSVRVELKIEKEEAENLRLLWEITDTGIGLPPHFLEKGIGEYDKGFPGRALTESAGLGLSIASRMAKALGGNLTYRRRPEGGTVFSFRMTAHIHRVGNEKPLEGQELIGRRILVVDEISVSRLRLKQWIEEAGSIVFESSSFAQAIELATHSHPDALIVVLNPIQLEALRETLFILKRPPLAEIKPAIAVLPHGESRQEIQQNFDLVLHQPLNPVVLIEKLVSLAGITAKLPDLNLTAVREALMKVSPTVLEELKSLTDKYLSTVPGFHDLEKEKLFAEKLIHWALRQNMNIFINFGKTLLLYLNRLELDDFEALTKQLTLMVNHQLNHLAHE